MAQDPGPDRRPQGARRARPVCPVQRACRLVAPWGDGQRKRKRGDGGDGAHLQPAAPRAPAGHPVRVLVGPFPRAVLGFDMVRRHPLGRSVPPRRASPQRRLPGGEGRRAAQRSPDDGRDLGPRGAMHQGGQRPGPAAPAHQPHGRPVVLGDRAAVDVRRHLRPTRRRLPGRGRDRVADRRRRPPRRAGMVVAYSAGHAGQDRQGEPPPRRAGVCPRPVAVVHGPGPPPRLPGDGRGARGHAAGDPGGRRRRLRHDPTARRGRAVCGRRGPAGPGGRANREFLGARDAQAARRGVRRQRRVDGDRPRAHPDQLHRSRALRSRPRGAGAADPPP